jgi:hypothetical protein
MANVYHIAAARLAVFGRRHRSVSSRGYLRLIVSIDRTNSFRDLIARVGRDIRRLVQNRQSRVDVGACSAAAPHFQLTPF